MLKSRFCYHSTSSQMWNIENYSVKSFFTSWNGLFGIFNSKSSKMQKGKISCFILSIYHKLYVIRISSAFCFKLYYEKLWYFEDSKALRNNHLMGFKQKRNWRWITFGAVGNSIFFLKILSMRINISPGITAILWYKMSLAQKDTAKYWFLGASVAERLRSPKRKF